MQPFDLNLLVALDALLAEESVTRAADRLSLSVPAMSRALGRIREALGDPLLVRAGRRLVLTPRALELRGRVQALVYDAQGLAQSTGGAALARLNRAFTVRCTDAVSGVIGVQLVERLRAVAPEVSVRFLPEGDEDVAALRNGAVDLDIGVAGPLGPEIKVSRLMRQRFVGVVRAGHPLLEGELTARRFAACEHISLSRRGRLAGPVDAELSRRGLSRRVVMSVSSAFNAVSEAAGSDLVASVPELFAVHVAERFRVQVFGMPVPVPPLVVSLAWHPRFDSDPAHGWLRELVKEVSAEAAARAKLTL